MNQRISDIITWLPRVLALLFAFFIGLFALDVFNDNYGLAKTLVAVSIHLIPTYIILIFTAVAWKREGLGAMLFAIIGIGYIANFKDQPFLTYAVISGPLFLIAFLFLINKIIHVRG